MQFGSAVAALTFTCNGHNNNKCRSPNATNHSCLRHRPGIVHVEQADWKLAAEELAVDDELMTAVATICVPAP